MDEIKWLLNSEIDNLKDDIINSTVELIRIKSVEDRAKIGMPFGEGVYKALKFCEDLSRKLGFKTVNYDGYALEAEYGDRSEDVCVIGHLDVVPEGDGWTFSPYEGVIHDGKIYGRGAIDDKGPTIAALYGMFVVKKLAEEKKLSINKSLRFVFGTNEESGSECLKYYFKKAKYPTVGFTPDADFPVIHGEKGFLVFELKKKVNCNIFIEGGQRPNMVPDSCVFKGEFDIEKVESVIKQKNLQEKAFVEKENNEYLIQTKGISAHGSLPFKGENAISYMFDILQDAYPNKDDDFYKLIEFYNSYISYDVFGKKLNIGFEDEKSGKLVFNVGTIRKIDDEIVIAVNIRYPVETKLEDIIKEIKGAIENYGIEFNLISHMEPLYFEKDHFLVKTLLEVYREFTESQDEPLVIGGGTYARYAKNILAFGPNMPGDEELAHQKDEYITIERLIDCAKIYANAIYRLAR